MLNVFMNTWGNYNENGADGGEWLTLPMDAEELETKLDEIAVNMGDNDPEWFINDYEWTTEESFFEVSENDDLDKILDWLDRLETLVDYQAKALLAIMDAVTSDFEEALRYVEYDNFEFYEGYDLEEVAEEIVQDCYFTKDTPEIFERYFDYEAFARDLGFDGYEETSYGVIKVF